jgi:hypothetical protein
MREFYTDLTPFLKAGLRKDFRNSINSPALIGCNNLKPTEWGLAPYQPVQVPISSSVLASWSLDLNWPYPRLHKGKKNLFLSSKDALFYIKDDWSIQQIDIYSWSTPTQMVAPTAGDLWQLIDFYDTFIFTNGEGCVFHTNLREILGQSSPERVFYSSSMRATAGVDWKGRAVLAGFSPDRTWNSKLTSIFQFGNLTQQSMASFSGVFKGFQDNFVMWSSIGGGDLLFWFDENVNFNFNEIGWIQTGNTGYGSTNPFVLEAFRKNQLGYMPMEWRGMVRRLKQLGDNLIVYGDGGVSELFTTVEPVATVGQRLISEIGIIGSGAVDGDRLKHVYMDSS